MTAVETQPTDVEDAPTPEGKEFTLTLIDEAAPTIDGRLFEPDQVTWRDPPLPLMFLTENGPDGHKGSKVGGVIEKIWRDGDKVLGMGHYDNGENGAELQRLVDGKILTGVSSDVGGALINDELAEDGSHQQRIMAGKIMGATVLPFPAFDDTRITSITAAALAALDHPPVDWFSVANLTKPTPLTVTNEGQVFGHAALWDSCHIGKPGVCLSPPRGTDYSYFTTGEVETAEGKKIGVGPITLGTGHAGLTLNSRSAAAHYDNTGTAVADVRVGEDEFGIWVAGALRPTVTPERARELQASALSGDWRTIRGELELVALLAVNTPGFPVPRPSANFAAEHEDQALALVAAGVITDEVRPADRPKTNELHVDVIAHVKEPVVACVQQFGSTREDEDEAELIARVEQLEHAIAVLAARRLDLNVGSGKKCGKCGGTVASGRGTCQNCGGNV